MDTTPLCREKATTETYRKLLSLQQRVSKAHRQLIHSYFIVPELLPPQDLSASDSILMDGEHFAHERYGVSSACLYLIRPDWYIGFRGGIADSDRLLDYLARTLTTLGESVMSSSETTVSFSTSQLIHQIYAADEALDADAFVALLTEDVQFRLGSNPLVAGRESVRQIITTFFSTVQGLQHHLIKAWEYGTTVIFQAEVTYIRKDGSQVTVPYVDVLELESARIKDYKIYIDLAPLQQL